VRVEQLVGECPHYPPPLTGEGGAIGGGMSVHVRFKQHMPSGEIVINSSPRGGAIGFSSLLALM
jgi:hypothetical protein